MPNVLYVNVLPALFPTLSLKDNREGNPKIRSAHTEIYRICGGSFVFGLLWPTNPYLLVRMYVCLTVSVSAVWSALQKKSTDANALYVNVRPLPSQPPTFT